MSSSVRLNEVRFTSGFIRCRVMALGRANSRSPSAPWIRPKPESPEAAERQRRHAGEGDDRVDRGHAADRRDRAARHRGLRFPANTVPPRPYRLAFASSTPSARLATLVTVIVGPKVSSVTALALLGHVGEDHRPDVRPPDAGDAADDGPAAAGQGVRDVLLDDLGLARHGHRAVVGLPVIAGPHLRDPVGELLQEPVGRRPGPRTPARRRRRSGPALESAPQAHASAAASRSASAADDEGVLAAALGDHRGEVRPRTRP
jgi:hypothetical protein